MPQTHRQTDMATLSPTRPSGAELVQIESFISLYFFFNCPIWSILFCFFTFLSSVPKGAPALPFCIAYNDQKYLNQEPRKQAYWVNLSKRGGKDGVFQGQPCQLEENPVLPDSFTQIYILFLIGFYIGPPKIHSWFRIGLPKIHRWFCIGPPPNMQRRFLIGPPQVYLNLLPLEFHRRGVLLTIANIMKEKQQNNLFEI